MLTEKNDQKSRRNTGACNSIEARKCFNEEKVVNSAMCHQGLVGRKLTYLLILATGGLLLTGDLVRKKPGWKGLKREDRCRSREDSLEIKLTILISLLKYFQTTWLIGLVFFFQSLSLFSTSRGHCVLLTSFSESHSQKKS